MRTGQWLAALLVLGLAPALPAQEAAQEATMAVAQTTQAADGPAAETAASAVVALEGKLAELAKWTDLLWTCVAAFLVFFMQAGFAMVETGFTRAKNAVNILMKNLMDFVIGSLVFWLFGFGLMFGASQGWIGTTDFMPNSADASTLGFWLFQVVFAATAATIVSGAMAERTKFIAYLLYSAIISAVIYPIFGGWAWGGLFHGGGWLENLHFGGGPDATPFIDFAGSTMVHSIGGWCALVGALILGPRIGKIGRDGKPRAMPGHNIPLAALGVFILWLGWFGFNPGSTCAIGGGTFAIIAVTTNLAGAAGALTAMITAWAKFGKPDASMTFNGALAGLVAITAPCANVSPSSAIVIGAVAGVLVVLAVVFFEHVSILGRRIDDPVGAISVHGVCGAWGTLSVGLFAQESFGGVKGLFYGGGFTQLGVQLVGVLSCFTWTVLTAVVMFTVLSKTVGLRVTELEELEGLDIGEHGMEAYGGFVSANLGTDEEREVA